MHPPLPQVVLDIEVCWLDILNTAGEKEVRKVEQIKSKYRDGGNKRGEKR